MMRGSIPVCAVGIFSGSSHTSDFKVGTAAVLCQAPGVWVSAGTGRPGVSVLDGVERMICNFYLSVAARTIV